MKVLFIEYPKCSTCKKAKKYLDENNINYTDRHIVEENPTYDELKLWVEKFDFPIRKLFNTSGLVYRSMDLKNKLDRMSDDEKLKLLATDGMLVKRPIIVADNFMLVGFKEDQWDKLKESKYACK